MKFVIDIQIHTGRVGIKNNIVKVMDLEVYKQFKDKLSNKNWYYDEIKVVSFLCCQREDPNNF